MFPETHRGDREFLVWIRYSDLLELCDFLEATTALRSLNQWKWKRAAVMREIARRK